MSNKDYMCKILSENDFNYNFPYHTTCIIDLNIVNMEPNIKYVTMDSHMIKNEYSIMVHLWNKVTKSNTKFDIIFDMDGYYVLNNYCISKVFGSDGDLIKELRRLNNSGLNIKRAK